MVRQRTKEIAIPTWYEELENTWTLANEYHNSAKSRAKTGAAYEGVAMKIAMRFEQHRMTWRDDIASWGVRGTRSRNPFHSIVNHLHRRLPAKSKSVVTTLAKVLDLWCADQDRGLAPDGMLVWLHERGSVFKVYRDHLAARPGKAIRHVQSRPKRLCVLGREVMASFELEPEMPADVFREHLACAHSVLDQVDDPQYQRRIVLQ